MKVAIYARVSTTDVPQLMSTAIDQNTGTRIDVARVNRESRVL